MAAEVVPELGRARGGRCGARSRRDTSIGERFETTNEVAELARCCFGHVTCILASLRAEVTQKRYADVADRKVKVAPMCVSLVRDAKWQLRLEGRAGMGIISWLVVGAIAGYLAGLLVKGDESFGVIGHIVLGIVGAIVGGFIAGVVTGGDYITGINIPTIVVATIGAVIAVIVANAVRGTTRAGRGPV